MHKSVKDDNYLSDEQLSMLFHNTFNTDAGKKVLAYFMEEFYDKMSFVKGDTHMTYYNEGQRSVVKLIKEFIEGVE